MAVKMRTGRLTAKTTDPKTGARVVDPSVYGMEVDGGKVSSWPEVRTMYQQGKLKKEFSNRSKFNPEVMSYLEGKTSKLSDTEYEEPILLKSQDASGSYTSVAMNLKKGGKRYQAMESSFGGSNSNTPGFISQYDVSEVPLSGSNKMQGRGEVTDLDVIRSKKSNINPSESKRPELMQKMPVGKASLKPTKGKLKVTEKEEYAFANPKKKIGDSVSMNPLAGGAKTKGAGKRYAKQVVESAIKPKNIGYNREQALFEAKAGTSVSGRDFSNMSAAEIKSKRSELKQDRRDYRKSSLDYDVKAPSIKEATMDIRQARKAEIYTRKAEAGKLDYFTPGYKKNEDKQAVNRIEAFKGSTDNAANRNTMKAKLDAISSKKSNKTNMY